MIEIKVPDGKIITNGFDIAAADETLLLPREEELLEWLTVNADAVIDDYPQGGSRKYVAVAESDNHVIWQPEQEVTADENTEEN